MATPSWDGNDAFGAPTTTLCEWASAPNESAGDRRVTGRRLAEFADAFPGQLESALRHRVNMLAQTATASSSIPTVLAALWEQPVPSAEDSGPLDPFFERVDPKIMLQLFSASRCRRDAFSHPIPDLLAEYFAQKVELNELDVLGLVPEARDVLRARLTGEQLPSILSDELAELSLPEIEASLETYTGIKVAQLEARMRPGGMSVGGFIGPQDRLIEVIAQDAKTLKALGISRHAIADRIELLLGIHAYNEYVQGQDEDSAPEVSSTDDSAWHAHHAALKETITAQIGKPDARGLFSAPWRIEMIVTMGHQNDPFHASDVYDLHQLGSSEFHIKNKQLWFRSVLKGPDLIVSHIRRACFFEGHVSYRVDPARAVRVLGLKRGEVPDPLIRRAQTNPGAHQY